MQKSFMILDKPLLKAPMLKECFAVPFKTLELTAIVTNR
jgi:hypothetical protein